jgi:uncharacterized protein YkwD
MSKLQKTVLIVALVVAALVAAVTTSPASPAWGTTLTYVMPTGIKDLVNYHRVHTHGYKALRYDWSLAHIACRHATRMAAAKRIFHEDISKTYYVSHKRWAWLGQNVGMTSDPKGPRSLYWAYKASPTHHAVFHYRYANAQGDCAVWDGHYWWHVHNFARWV